MQATIQIETLPQTFKFHIEEDNTTRFARNCGNGTFTVAHTKEDDNIEINFVTAEEVEENFKTHKWLLLDFNQDDTPLALLPKEFEFTLSTRLLKLATVKHYTARMTKERLYKLTWFEGQENTPKSEIYTYDALSLHITTNEYVITKILN